MKVQISGWVLDKDEEPVANAIIRIVGNDGSNQKALPSLTARSLFRSNAE